MKPNGKDAAFFPGNRVLRKDWDSGSGAGFDEAKPAPVISWSGDVDA